MLSILIFITLAGGLILTIGILNEGQDFVAAGLVVIILNALFGWGLIGGFITKNTTAILCTPDIYKTKTSVIVEYKNNRRIFEDIQSYNTICDTTKFILETSYNIYGRKLTDEIKIKEQE